MVTKETHLCKNTPIYVQYIPRHMHTMVCFVFWIVLITPQTPDLGYWHGLTLIPVWISNHMPSKMWDEITYPFPNFNGINVAVWVWIRNFNPQLVMNGITYPCWYNSTLIERAHGCVCITISKTVRRFSFMHTVSNNLLCCCCCCCLWLIFCYVHRFMFWIRLIPVFFFAIRVTEKVAVNLLVESCRIWLN